MPKAEPEVHTDKNGHIGEFDIDNSPVTRGVASKNNPFKKAEKRSIKLRLGLAGPSGSGKTMTAMKCAKELGGPVAVIDTEHGSSKRYADEFDFDSIDLADFDPDNYVELIHAAEKAGYAVIIIDSLSHAWNGKNGMLDLADQAAKRSKSGNSFQAWGEIKPKEVKLWEAILDSSCHIIATLRTKTEYLVEANEKGKMAPRKIGTAPVQRQDVEYEFDIVGDMDLDNSIQFSKTRCSALKGKLLSKPGKNVMDIIIPWLGAPDESDEPVSRATILQAVSGKIEAETDPAEDEHATEFYSAESGPLADRCMTAEEYLTKHKVKGWHNEKAKLATRAKYAPNGVLVNATPTQLEKYLDVMNDAAESVED